MGLLYPLMAFGFPVAAVPIWLHLRRRDETNLVEFSTLRFLDDQPLARARPLWPRNWPLLLLRLAALLLLVAAFMWPYFEDSETVVVRESRVYILDNTLSHQVDGAFETARDQIADELAKQDVGVQIGVVELSSTASRHRPLRRQSNHGGGNGPTSSNPRPSEDRSSMPFARLQKCSPRHSVQNVGLC